MVETSSRRAIDDNRLRLDLEATPRSLCPAHSLSMWYSTSRNDRRRVCRDLDWPSAGCRCLDHCTGSNPRRLEDLGSRPPRLPHQSVPDTKASITQICRSSRWIIILADNARGYGEAVAAGWPPHRRPIYITDPSRIELADISAAIAKVWKKRMSGLFLICLIDRRSSRNAAGQCYSTARMTSRLCSWNRMQAHRLASCRITLTSSQVWSDLYK
jgi:hypothetical protein